MYCRVPWMGRMSFYRWSVALAQRRYLHTCLHLVYWWGWIDQMFGLHSRRHYWNASYGWNGNIEGMCVPIIEGKSSLNTIGITCHYSINNAHWYTRSTQTSTCHTSITARRHTRQLFARFVIKIPSLTLLYALTSFAVQFTAWESMMWADLGCFVWLFAFERYVDN